MRLWAIVKEPPQPLAFDGIIWAWNGVTGRGERRTCPTTDPVRVGELYHFAIIKIKTDIHLEMAKIVIWAP